MKISLLLVLGLVCCAAGREYSDATLRRCGELIGLQCPIHSWCIPDNCRVEGTIDATDPETGKELICPGCDSSNCGYKTDSSECARFNN